MSKKKFQTPEIEYIDLELENVILESVGPNDGNKKGGTVTPGDVWPD